MKAWIGVAVLFLLLALVLLAGVLLAGVPAW